MTLVFLKVHTRLQRVGKWPFHALSAGELSQKPAGLKLFVLVSLLCPCIAKEKPDILNMKIFHILQGNLLVPEIAGFGNQPRPLKIAPTAPWKACTIWAPGGLPPSELPDRSHVISNKSLYNLNLTLTNGFDKSIPKQNLCPNSEPTYTYYPVSKNEERWDLVLNT